MAPERRCIVNGTFAENCWMLIDRARREAVLVDPGEEADRFLAIAADEGLTVTAVWLTHAHIDHVLGVGRVVEATGAPVFLHPADRPLYDRVPQQAAMFFGRVVPPLPAPTDDLDDGQVLAFGGAEFLVRHVPGHSPGHVAFLTDGWVLGGDVLFQGSVGRVDLPGGNAEQLLASLDDVFLPLPDDTVICPGHGPETTIGHERAANPFVNGAVRLV